MTLLTTLRSALTPIQGVVVAGPAAHPPVPLPERAGQLEQLYREHADRIYGLCLRMSGDAAEATELAQDVFVRAWQKLPQLRPGSDAGAWLWRLATNVVLNARRSERRRRARVAPVPDLSLVERVSMRTPMPIRQLSLETAIAKLPDRARAVYLLHDVEGFAHAEVAAMLGVAEGTVRAHLHRARSLLREVLR